MKPRIYTLAPHENWIVDRFVDEWNSDNPDYVAGSPSEADVIWLFAGWAWDRVDIMTLAKKKVVTTIHHIVPEKFDRRAAEDFHLRDKVTTAYHVPNIHTAEHLKQLTKKPVIVVPYWANQRIWKRTGVKRDDLRKKFGIPDGRYVCSSFQRDTEGRDLRTPKYEKGPDLLADFLEQLNRKRGDVHVLLGGWRRQYIMGRLGNARIPFTYVEMPPQETVNDMYQVTDLYPVTSRYEGGPQSLIECGLLNVPVISRDIGMAYLILPPEAISDDLTIAFPTVPNVEDLKLPSGYNMYHRMFDDVMHIA